jgi:hypothetical protein
MKKTESEYKVLKGSDFEVGEVYVTEGQIPYFFLKVLDKKIVAVGIELTFRFYNGAVNHEVYDPTARSIPFRKMSKLEAMVKYE